MRPSAHPSRVNARSHAASAVPRAIALVTDGAPYSDLDDAFDRQLAARYGPDWIMTMPF
jgi:hypothetical protein